MNRRIDYIDQLKGLGIILVVVGHFIEPYRERSVIFNIIYVVIYSFHMPMFCLLSGIVAKSAIKKICFKWVWIYLLAQLFYLPIRCLVEKENIGGDIFLPYWHMWYLYALIIWQLSLLIIDRLRRYIPKIILVLSYLIIILLSGYIDLKFSLTRVVVFYIFYLTGYLYKDSFIDYITKKKELWFYLICFIVFVALLALVGIKASYINSSVLWESKSYYMGNYSIYERALFVMIGFWISCLMLKITNLNIPASVSLLSGDRKPQICF